MSQFGFTKVCKQTNIDCKELIFSVDGWKEGKDNEYKLISKEVSADTDVMI